MQVPDGSQALYGIAAAERAGAPATAGAGVQVFISVLATAAAAKGGVVSRGRLFARP